jgi:putative protease
MSPKDLCTIDFLDEVADAGIKVLKIEGRGRAPEYVARVIKCYRDAIDSLNEGTYEKEKVIGWMQQLEKVYNRGFWSGYYLGQKLGEWSKGSGSHATQKKVYIGKGMHFFPKAQIGEFKIEAFNLTIGDTILITGPTTGAKELQVEEMMVNDQKISNASKGDMVTIPLEFRIRQSDRLYKIVENKVEA